VIELRHVGQDGELVQLEALQHVLGVQQRWDPKMFFRNRKRQLTVPPHTPSLQTCIVQQLRPEPVYDGTESQAIPPRLGHVNNPNPSISSSHPATPDLQACCSSYQHCLVNTLQLATPDSSLSLQFWRQMLLFNTMF